MFGEPLRAVDFTWTATTNTNWTTTTAWSPNGTPGVLDSVIGPSGTSAIGNLQINYLNRQVTNFVAQQSAGTWNIRAAATGSTDGNTHLTVSGTLLKRNAGTVIIRGTDTIDTLTLSVGALHVEGGFLAFGNANSSNPQYVSGLSAGSTRVAENAALQLYVFTGSDGAYSLGSVDNNGTMVIGARGAAVSVPAEARMNALSGTNALAVITGLTTPVLGSGVSSTVHILGTADATYAGTFSDGSLGAVVHIVKSGSAVQVLAGSGSHTGATVVNAGTLVVNGAMASSAAAVNDGGTLRGDGSVASLVVADGGTLSPGDTQGIFTVAGNLELQNGASTHIEIGGNNRGVTYDGINLGGTLTYGGELVFEFLNAPGIGDFTIFDGFTLVSGDFFAVNIAGAYAVALTLSGEVWSGDDGSTAFRFDQSTGSLTLSAVPEPGAAILLGIGLALVIARRRMAR